MKKVTLILMSVFLWGYLSFADKPEKISKDERQRIKYYIIQAEKFEKKAAVLQKQGDKELSEAFRKCGEAKKSIAQALLEKNNVEIDKAELADTKALKELEKLAEKRKIAETDLANEENK